MSKKSLLVVAILIFNTKLQAREPDFRAGRYRTNLNLSLKSDQIYHDKMAEDSTVENRILEELNAREIGFDSKTVINIHTEKDRVDFSCFNCIIRELSPNDKDIYSAWNGRQLGAQ